MLVLPKYPLIGAFVGFLLGTVIWACFGFADGKEIIPAMATFLGAGLGSIEGLWKGFDSRRPPRRAKCPPDPP
jgi:hypothetical protein